MHLVPYPLAARLTPLVLALALAACGGSNDDADASALRESSATASLRSQLPNCPAPGLAVTSIGSVQGPGAVSPLVGQTVAVRGIVTADWRGGARLNGLFIQQPDPDNDRATSEGLFVFAPSDATPVNIGDLVQVEGRVAEFQRSGERASLTQITPAGPIVVCGAAEPIKPTTLTLPVKDADELESVEGMLVRFQQPLHVSGNFTLGRFGELVLSAQDRLYHPNNHPELGPDEARVLNARSRLVLDDTSSVQNPNPIPFLSAPGTEGTRRAGDVVKKLEGILTWGFGTYRLQPTQTPAFEPRNARPAAPAQVGGNLKVASLNVLNYFTTLGQRGASNAAELQRQQDKLVTTIVGLDADVLGLIEIENNDGVALRRLVDAINARLGRIAYDFRSAGVAGTDAIKVAVIHKPDRVAAIGNPAVPDDPDFVVDGGLRPPVAQRFAARDNGGGFWFVVTHFKSKGSCPSSAQSIDADRGQGCWNDARTRQARALERWVATLVAGSGEADVLMAGDFNAYLKEDPLALLAAAGHGNLLERLAPTDRYSYVFDSEAGALDHALANATMAAQVSGIAIWHSNADEAPVLDYNTEFKTDDRYAPSAFRASDHDPVLVGLALSPDAPASAPTLEATLPTVGVVGTPVRIEAIRATASSPTAAATLSVDWGNGRGFQPVPALPDMLANTYAEAGTYAVRLRLSEAGALAAELVTTVRVAPRPPEPGAGLFISEYVEGSSLNKAIEIFNPGTAAVELSACTLRLYSNGSASATASFVLSGTLAAETAVVVYNAGFALPSVPAGALVGNSVINFNGDDALTLECNGQVVDQFGQVGFDPGTAWTSGSVTTLDRTLRRKAGITRGSVPPAAWDVSLEWDVLPQNTVDGLGTR